HGDEQRRHRSRLGAVRRGHADAQRALVAARASPNRPAAGRAGPASGHPATAPAAPHVTRRHLPLVTAAALVLLLTGAAAGYDPKPASTWVVSGGSVGGGVVATVATSGSTAYLGGNFSYVGPATGSFVPVDPTTGELSSPWPVVGGDVYAAVGDGFGGYYIGGSVSSVGTTPIANVAHIFFDGTVRHEGKGGTDGPVYALARSGSGGGVTLYVGGAFTKVDGQSHAALAAIDVDGALVSSFNPAFTGTGPSVLALSIANSVLYVGGSFGSVGGG